jgi:WD40 repeat protein/serine/threonine protein kinase
MNQTEDRPPSASIPAPDAPPSSLAAEESRVIRVVQDYLALMEAGHQPDRKEFLGRYPEIAGTLAECLAGLEFVHAAAPDLSQPPGGGGALGDIPAGVPLGDFRMIREIGRGGMGIVYEAEQLSLGRRVALKVLPFAAALDPRQLQRFKNEAQAAAHLQHQHIVPVYYVGCERGVHFYAMQLIEGHTLAAVIKELGQLAGPEGRAVAAGSLASELVSGQWVPPSPRSLAKGEQGGEGDPQRTTDSAPVPEFAPPPTAPVAALSTERSTRSAAFFRTVAHLGVQAAEALEYAHQMGVIHRDIKPGNLMVDATGRLWVTDFGLARLGTDPGLTMTGDLLGTLRYMSPEQALGQRVVVDHRTDLYSLGVTLYELLTLERAYGGHDRQEVLRQIALEEPPPPRRLNKAVPGELETIVLKAMAKSPEERYATAQELADDLRRWLEDKPIRARRPSLRQRGVKWARRHRTVVRAAVVVAALAVVALAVSTLLIWRAQGRTEAANRELQTNLYFKNIALAEREWSVNNLARMNLLLAECPKELRGWEWYYLKRLPHGGLPPLRHGRAVMSVAISPDGQRIASSSNDGFVILWNAQTGQKLFPGFKGHEGVAQTVAFSPDSRLLATGGTDPTGTHPPPGTVKVWDAKTGQLLRQLKGHSNMVVGIAFSPDGQRLASVSWVRRNEEMPSRGEMKIWDVTTGNLLLTVPGHESLMNCVAFSPDGKRLATSGSQDTTVKIWDAQTGEEQRTFRGHNHKVQCVAFSPDGKRLAWGSTDSTVKVWDIPERRAEAVNPLIHTLRGHTGWVLSVAFSPDGQQIASASSDGTVRVWKAPR